MRPGEEVGVKGGQFDEYVTGKGGGFEWASGSVAPGFSWQKKADYR
jgi:hypothetical protein